MARPQKKGMSYFPLDCGIFSANSDLKPLIRRFGAVGLAVTIHVFCDVYSNGYYYKPQNIDDYYYEIADDCNVSVNSVQQVISFLCDRSLLCGAYLSRADTVITSHGIQKRYVEAMKTRKRTAEQIKGEYWLLSDEEMDEILCQYNRPDSYTQNANYSENNHSFSEKNTDKSEIYDTNKIKENKRKYNNSSSLYTPAHTREEKSFQNGNSSNCCPPAPTREEVKRFFEEMKINISYTDFFDYYNAVSWTIRGEPIQDWKRLAVICNKNAKKEEQSNLSSRRATSKEELDELVKISNEKYKF